MFRVIAYQFAIALNLIVFATTSFSANADVVITPNGMCGANCTIYRIVLTGEINEQTQAQFISAVNDPRVKTLGFNPIVALNSPGGSVVQAIEIGRALRKANLLTAVFGNAECSSSCVLILAAGVDRIADYGRVGIHRPRFDELYFAALSPEAARTKYEEMSSAVRQYLTQMGMADMLYLDMLKISSDDVKYLSAVQMHEYGLIGRDPAWAEYNRAQAIRTLGREQFEISQSYSAVVLACYNNSGLGTATCDRNVKPLFDHELANCALQNVDQVACAKSIEQRLKALYERR